MISLALLCALTGQPEAASPAQPVTIRVATFNVHDIRTPDLADGQHPRLKRLAALIQQVRPNVLLLNEVAYDQPGAPGVAQGAPAGTNGQKFADLYLAVSQGAGLEPLRFRAFSAPVNTGVASGFDLDNDGRVVTTYPEPAAPKPDGTPGPTTREHRAYGNDCWGFGTFPGQYGMVLLADERLSIDAANARTFQRLPWDYMPGAYLPEGPDGATPWFDEKEIKLARLSSKSHWDVPVALPNGATVHFLCSHPTPPAFDGREMRNQRRNHDEIRFWADYIESASYIVDDANQPGGLGRHASFVILGDLNADPDEGSSFKDPIDSLLVSCKRINMTTVPLGDITIAGLDEDDTSAFGLRVDYVLPSTDLTLNRSGVWRTPPSGEAYPSDHFLVWAELTVPPPPENP